MKIVKKDYAISVLRVMALSLVIGCHLLEWIHDMGENYPLVVKITGNYFAVGVQIFLMISGFLYGSKENLFGDGISRVTFVKKNFWKILKDYYIYYLLVIIPLCFLLKNPTMTPDAVFGALTGWRTFGRALHLWFIPYILFCYLLTPIIYDIREWICKKNVVVGLAGLLILIEVLFLSYQSYFAPAWICAYVIGFFLPKLKGTIIWRRGWYWYAVVVCVLGNGIKIYLKYFRGIFYPTEVPGLKGIILTECYNWVTVLLAFVIFVGLYEVLHKALCKREKMPFLDWTDEYSYDIYISHMLFVKGMLSTVFLTGFLPLDLVITFALIIFSGILLHYVTGLGKYLWKEKLNCRG